MKFLFINTGTKEQNAGIVRCLSLGGSLVSLGHEVIILITNNNENKNTYGYLYNNIRFVYVNKLRGLEQLGKLVAILRTKDVDIVHCMGAGSSIFFPALIARDWFRKKIKIVLDFEDKQLLLVPENRKKIQGWLEKIAIKKSDQIICASRLLTIEYAKSKKNVDYLPFGFDENQINCSKRKRVGMAGKKIRMGYLGSLIDPYKEQMDFLVNSIPHFRKREVDIQIEVGGSGPLKNKYIEEVTKLGYQSELKFLGFIPDKKIEEFLGGMDVLVMSINKTPMNLYRCPHKIFLYAATSRPIVTNNIGEVGNLLKDYPNKVFFIEGCIESFVNAVREAAKLDHPIDNDYYRMNSWRRRAEQYIEIVNLI